MKQRIPLELSVIIPAYNESSRLPQMLKVTKEYLEKQYPNRFEILVVDDGSTDDTAALVANTLGDHALIRQPTNLGKGAAVRKGVLAARGKFILFTDADGSTPIEEIEKLQSAINAGADLAIGSRGAAGGIRVFGSIPAVSDRGKIYPNSAIWYVQPHRHYLGRIFAFVVRHLLHLPFADTQCGFKMFWARSAQQIFSLSKVDGFAFDVEILYIASKLGLKCKEIPTSWHDCQGSKVRLISDSIKMFVQILKLLSVHYSARSAHDQSN